MNFRFLGLVCAAMLLSASTGNAGLWDRIKSKVGEERPAKPPTIKVLIARDMEGVTLEVQGRYNIYDPYTSRRLATRFVPKRNFLQPVLEGIKWGETFPGTYQLVFVPDNIETTISVNGIQYRGSVFVYQIDNKLALVNEVAIEDYVNSILAVQFDTDMPGEAMASLAIAARTDAVHQALASTNPYFDVVADDVGYEGHAVTRPGDLISQSMQSTRHLILSSNRAFQGELTPIQTSALDKEYGKKETNSSWNLSEAKKLASDGANAARILERFFPNESIELAETMPRHIPAAMKMPSSYGISDAAPCVSGRGEELR